MLKITFIPKMPSPKTCHLILILLASLISVSAGVLLLHNHYEAVRILIFLGAFPMAVVFLFGAKGVVSTFTCTATASDKTTKTTTDKATDKITSKVTRAARPTAISNPSLTWYTSLIFISLAFLAIALAMWLFSYSPEDLDAEMHGVTGVLMVLAIVLVVVGWALNMMDSAREIKRNWEQKKSVGRKGKGVESV